MKNGIEFEEIKRKRLVIKVKAENKCPTGELQYKSDN
jgi:hypothetical protein